MLQKQKKSKFNFLTKLLSQFDLFGKEVSLNFEQKNNFKSAFGGFGTIVIFTLIVIFFFRSITTFTNKENITVKKTSSYDTDPSTITIDPKEMVFAMKMNHDNFATRPMFNVTLQDRYYERVEGGQINKTITDVPLEQCTLEHFTQLNSHKKQIDWEFNYNLYGLGDYICPPLNYEFKLGGMYTSDKFHFQRIVLSLCQNQTDIIDDSKEYTSACATAEEIEEYRTSDYSSFSLYFPNKLVNPDDPQQPVRDFFFDEVFFDIQAGKMYRQANIFFRETILETDESVWPYEDIQYEYINLFEPGDMREMFSVGKEQAATFFLRRSPQTQRYERKYQKIDDILAYIGGFIQAVIIGVGFFISYYNELQFTFSLANKIYNFDDKDTKKKEYQKIHQQIQNLYDGSGNKKINSQVKLDYQARKSQYRVYSMHPKDIKYIILERQQYLEKIYNLEKQQNEKLSLSKSDQQEIQNSLKAEQYIVKNKQIKQNKYQRKQTISDSLPQPMINKLYEGLGFKSRNDFLYKQFQEIVNRKQEITITFKYILNQMTCGFLYNDNTQVDLLNKAYKRIQIDLDIYQIIDNIKEIEKLKNVLFDKDQKKLFNFFPKPTISVQKTQYTEDQNFLNIIQVKNDQVKQQQQQQQQNQQNKNEGFSEYKNLSILEIVRARKYANKIKQIIKESLDKKKLDQKELDMINYQQIYDSYDILINQDNNNIHNKRLISLLGNELQSIFDTSQLIHIKEKQENNVSIDNIKADKENIFIRNKVSNSIEITKNFKRSDQNNDSNNQQFQQSARESDRNMLKDVVEVSEDNFQEEQSCKNMDSIEYQKQQEQQQNQESQQKKKNKTQSNENLNKYQNQEGLLFTEENSECIVIDTQQENENEKENQLKNKIINQDQISQENNRQLMSKIGQNQSSNSIIIHIKSSKNQNNQQNNEEEINKKQMQTTSQNSQDNN